ncbi:MAG: hypothetical protein ACR2OU_21365 [Thermomicrobiales bacterium]
MSSPYTSPQRRFNPWSQPAAIVSAGLQALTDSMLHPVIMLSTIAYVLGGSTFAIAAFAVIAAVCWSLGRMVVNPLVHLAGGPIPIAVGGLILRTGAILLIGFIGYRLDDIKSSDAIAGLISCYVLYQLGSMTTAFTTNGHVGAAHAPSKRSWIFRFRSIVTAASAMFAGIVAQSVFGSSSITFPHAVRYLFVFAAVSGVASAWFLIQMPRRGRGDISGTGSRVSNNLAPLMRIPAMRRYLGFRTLLGLSTLADPFIVMYGLQRIGFGLRYLGLALLFYAFFQFLGTITWPRWTRTLGASRLLQFAAFLRLAFLMLALAIPALAGSPFYVDRSGSQQLAAWAFAASFGLPGLCASIHNATNQQYLINIANVNNLNAAIGITNAILGITAFAPLVGAGFVNRFSLETTIAIGSVIAFLAFILSALLVESRSRARIRTYSRGLIFRRRRAIT